MDRVGRKATMSFMDDMAKAAGFKPEMLSWVVTAFFADLAEHMSEVGVTLKLLRLPRADEALETTLSFDTKDRRGVHAVSDAALGLNPAKMSVASMSNGFTGQVTASRTSSSGFAKLSTLSELLGQNGVALAWDGRTRGSTRTMGPDGFLPGPQRLDGEALNPWDERSRV